MPKLRPIDPKPFALRTDLPTFAPGKEPKLQWVEIRRLRVDDSYQREINGRGASNVRSIAINFSWSRFGTVIVAPVGEGVYAIIDGQHRTTAAALRGLTQVPCQVVTGNEVEQAKAFAAINGQVTKISTVQVHAARVAAGDVGALELDRVCSAAGVTICRSHVHSAVMRPGETLAASQLNRLLKRYGAELLTTALRCITKSGKGNPGMVRASIAGAICHNIDAEPEWRKSEKRLIEAFNRFNFADALGKAMKKAAEDRVGATAVMVDIVAEHLEAHMSKKAA